MAGERALRATLVATLLACVLAAGCKKHDGTSVSTTAGTPAATKLREAGHTAPRGPVLMVAVIAPGFSATEADAQLATPLGPGGSALVEAGWPTGLLPAGAEGRYEIIALRPEGAAVSSQRLAAAIATLPGIAVRGAGPLGEAANLWTVRLLGEDAIELRALAGRARDLVASLPGVRSAAVLDEEGQPELTARPSRELAARLGVRIAAIKEAVEAATGGVQVGEVRSAGVTLPVRFRIGRTQPESAAGLDDVTLRTSGGQTVRLSAVASLERSIVPAAVRRAQGRRYVALEVVTDGAEATEAARALLERSLTLPDGATVEWREEPELLR